MLLSLVFLTHTSSPIMDFMTTRSAFPATGQPVFILLVYPRSIGFSEECLGLHYGDLHDDLGDGDGRKIEQYLARQYYFPIWGTCWESLAGSCDF
jgi:hypothetical protein